MAQRLLVATRKGLFLLDEAEGWRAGTPAFLGEPVSAVLHDARDGMLYAALRLGHFGVKLHRSADGGATWQEVGVPALPKDGENPKALDMIWTLDVDHVEMAEVDDAAILAHRQMFCV